MVIASSDTFTEFQSQGISSMQTASGLSSYDADRTKAFQQVSFPPFSSFCPLIVWHDSYSSEIDI